MAHQYGLPVKVVQAPDGSPASFVWHGAAYEVAEVLSRWHLMDRWWERGDPYAALGFSDRHYFRVRCMPYHQIFDLYFDQAQHVWVLDYAHD
jgi:Family of unknown function (DUF6504)